MAFIGLGHHILLPDERELGTNRWQPQDAIDFTDNDIQLLGNFPLSPRLSTLLLARNRVAQIQPSVAQSIPNLTTLVLTSNNIAELADLDALGTLPKLTHLVLLENPVTRKEVGSSHHSRRYLGYVGTVADGINSTTDSGSSSAAAPSASSTTAR